MPRLTRATILVVDDDPGIREALPRILDDEYEVVDAADGGEALAALAVLASRRIDLILLDLVMTHADGFAVLERRRDEHKKVPIIVVSGVNNAGVTATAMRWGAVDYVTKPFDEDDLHERIRSTLGLGLRASARMSSILLIGLDHGVYASLAVLLRQQCRVAQPPTLIDALGSPASPAARVVAIHRRCQSRGAPRCSRGFARISARPRSPRSTQTAGCQSRLSFTRFGAACRLARRGEGRIARGSDACLMTSGAITSTPWCGGCALDRDLSRPSVRVQRSISVSS